MEIITIFVIWQIILTWYLHNTHWVYYDVATIGTFYFNIRGYNEKQN